MILFSGGSPETCFSLEEAKAALVSALDRLGPRKRVLVVPPDCTRRHSQAGPLTEAVWEYYGANLEAVLPALGTHVPMTEGEIGTMFGKVPKDLFRVHDWRRGVARLGEVPGDFVRAVSEGKVDYAIPVEMDKLIVEDDWDLILSIGQVVPHEVAGMAGYTKNILVGAGGPDVINKTHFLGAAYGLERIMGRALNPVRQVLDYGAEHFARALPIIHVLTVVGKGADGRLTLRGLTVGDGQECYARAAELAFKVNIELLDAPLRKVVVYLDPTEFKSTWLGNKSIYRSRLAMADGGELIVLAPGVARFGEDADIDELIRKYGYVGTPKILDLVKSEDDLQRNLSAAAHLIHGSSEGRFMITYCPGRLTRDEVEGVNFRYGDLDAMMKRFNPGRLVDGLNRMPDGEEVFFISKPGLGLWTCRERFPGV